MSSAEIAARHLRELESKDLKLLQAFERSIGSFELVPFEVLTRSSGLHKDEARFRLDKLHQIGLIVTNPLGYSMVMTGLDVLALSGFVKRGLISGMGSAIGVGKEADVFEAISDTGEKFAIKFYRLGRVSFRDARRKRGYAAPFSQHEWLGLNMQAAKREFEAISTLMPLGASVPEVAARERHALLMRLLEGQRLSEWRTLEQPTTILKEILNGLRISFTKGGVINADLSEYNILCDGQAAWIIDWPQAVAKTHPNAHALLERDVMTILRFFKRRYDVVCNPTIASLYVRGLTDGLEIILSAA